MRKGRSSAEAARVLRENDRDLAKGLTVENICRKLGIARNTHYRWRWGHDPRKVDADHRSTALEKPLPDRPE